MANLIGACAHGNFFYKYICSIVLKIAATVKLKSWRSSLCVVDKTTGSLATGNSPSGPAEVIHLHFSNLFKSLELSQPFSVVKLSKLLSFVTNDSIRFPFVAFDFLWDNSIVSFCDCLIDLFLWQTCFICEFEFLMMEPRLEKSCSG